MQAYFRTFY